MVNYNTIFSQYDYNHKDYYDSIPSISLQEPPVLQNDNSPEHFFEPKWYTMFTRIPRDISIFSQSIFKLNNLVGVLSISALTTDLMLIDEDTYRFTKKSHNSSRLVNNLSRYGVFLGDGRLQLGLAGVFATFGFINNDSRALCTASQIVEAVFACGIVVQTMKHITGRESPSVASKPSGLWHFFPNIREYNKHQSRYYAFPSGHFSTTMATLMVISENYPEIKFLRPISYAFLGILGLSLSNKGMHWFSDFPLGLALGYSFGMIASHQDGLDILQSKDSNSMKIKLVNNQVTNSVNLLISLPFIF
jgi:hypothetical protein